MYNVLYTISKLESKFSTHINFPNIYCICNVKIICAAHCSVAVLHSDACLPMHHRHICALDGNNLDQKSILCLYI